MRKEHIILIIIFALTLGTRLFLSFQTDSFTPDSYYHLRQIESIKQTGTPIINDQLSYGGRTQIIEPVFHYTIALFSFVMPTWVAAKILPQIYIALITILVYLISITITKNKTASLFTAGISAFIPVLYTRINQVNPASLLIPALLFFIYLILRPETKQITILILSFLLPLISPGAIILSITLILFLIISKLEKAKIERKDTEITLFITFIFLWIIFLMYKKALLINGALVIWQNIPKTILAQYFTQTTMLKAITLIGIIPIMTGAYVMYKELLNKSRATTLLTSMALTTFLLLVLRLVNMELGLTLLGLSLAIMFSQFYTRFFEYIEKTKLAAIKWPIFTLLIVLFILTNMIPSIAFTQEQNTITKQEAKAMSWLKENTEQDATVTAEIELGHAINQIAERKNIADTNFLLIENPAQRIEDIKTIMTTGIETNAVDKLGKYNATYIYIAEKNISLKYAEPKCFDILYNKTIKIYKSKCKLERR